MFKSFRVSFRLLVYVLISSVLINLIWICLFWPSNVDDQQDGRDCSNCPCEPLSSSDTRFQAGHKPDHTNPIISSAVRSRHKLAVIVPFRDRFDELLRFVPYMSRFLDQQGVNYLIMVVNQVDELRFNRATLINIGFKLTQHECDYMVMHDVDLLPLNKNLSYRYPSDKSGHLVSFSGPPRRSDRADNTQDRNEEKKSFTAHGGPVVHLASPEFHPKYHYHTFVGGILLVKREDFQLVNGLSNRYWGWGLEDDEFFARLRDAQLPILRPDNVLTGPNDTFQHIHGPARRRDMAKLHNQKEVTRKRDRETGLDTVEYDLVAENELTFDGFPAAIVNVKLFCDLARTPWCQYPKTGTAAKSPPPPPRKPQLHSNSSPPPSLLSPSSSSSSSRPRGNEATGMSMKTKKINNRKPLSPPH